MVGAKNHVADDDYEVFWLVVLVIVCYSSLATKITRS